MKTVLSLAFAFQLVALSLQLQYIQDDVLGFPRYKIVLTHEKVSPSALARRDVELSSKENQIVMTSSLGQPFSCSIPNVQIEEERLEREKKERAQKETEQDKQKTIQRGLELLEPLEASCIRFLTSSHQYWAYEYCHNQYVRQFHVERTNDGKVEKEQETDSYILGYHPNSKHIDSSYSDQTKALRAKKKVHTELRNVGDQRYLVQTWKDGSICDLTEKPRTVEVQYHCDVQGQDRVSSFVEVSTCNYQIIVSTSRLCEEMSLFRRHHTEPHQIKCRPIVSEELIEQEQQQDEELQEQKQKQEQQKEQQEEQQGQKEQSEITKDLPKKENEKDLLLNMIFDLKDQIGQLKEQLNNKNKQAEVAYFTMDEQGNIVPGIELSKLIGQGKDDSKATRQKKLPTKEQKAQEQHQNRQAYNQKYIALQQ
ncbi:Protein OS-9 [Choanephora cucurbitarum]|uniref:Protein OS-9 homolog n=1 Tax=Choanephora cucurbitarum TaxID=101091 RepID=A0A1C7NR36_9FUNG|nr:Protein OS-9 [Choanephora cucurbitarum]